MRDGPPHSTSSLLKEISSLRTRLKELEDDTRSSISGAVAGYGDDHKDGELMNALKKELAKVEHEKANLEKEFMNQLSSLAEENQKVVDDLRDKLVHAQAENELLRDNQDSERMMQLVEDERQRHAAEMNQLKATLASSDMEIADSRRELDHLHEQLDEMHLEKEELLREVTEVRLLYSEEQRRSESLRSELKESNVTVAKLQKEYDDKQHRLSAAQEQVGEMNDTLIELESHKEMLVAEVTDLKLELSKKSDSPRSSDSSKVDKERLEELEDRLERFQVKLEERDSKIDTLTSSLNEERRFCKALRIENKNLKLTQRIANSADKTSSREQSVPATLSLSPARGDNSTSPGEEPRTPVSGLVASFEQRIAHTVAESELEMNILESRLEKERERVQELCGKLADERDLVKDLKGKLANSVDREHVELLEKKLKASEQEVDKLRAKIDKNTVTILEYQDDLRSEQELVKELRTKLSETSATNEQTEQTEAKLLESEREIARLRAQVEGFEAARANIQERTRKEQAEMSKLRMKAHQANAEKRELEAKVVAHEREVERLKTELTYTLDVCSLPSEEKKDADAVVETEEMTRLRDQVSSLQGELELALAQIECLESEVQRLKGELDDASVAAGESKEETLNELLSKKSKKSYDTQINMLRVQLTKVQVAKQEQEEDFEKRVKELEDEIDALTVEADNALDEKDKEIAELREQLSDKAAAVDRLESEHSHIRESITDMSVSRQDEMDELQAEVIAMTSKCSAQTREIQSLKMKIEEHEARKGEVEQKLQSRIKDLEGQIETLKRNARNTPSNGNLEHLRQENIKLREAIRDIKLERRTLKERLESFTTDKSQSKSSQILRDRNQALKEEVEKLTKRLKKMEESMTRFAI